MYAVTVKPMCSLINSLRADTLNLVYIHTICDTWAGFTEGYLINGVINTVL